MSRTGCPTIKPVISPIRGTSSRRSLTRRSFLCCSRRYTSLGLQSDVDEGRVNSFLSAFTLDDLSCAEARTGVALFDCHPRSHRVQSLGLAIQRADPLGYSLSLFHVPRHLPDSQSVRNEARCERTDPLWASDRHRGLLVLRRANRWGGSAPGVDHLRPAQKPAAERVHGLDGDPGVRTDLHTKDRDAERRRRGLCRPDRRQGYIAHLPAGGHGLPLLVPSSEPQRVLE